jgi:predicted HTH domain antitoxin
MTITLDLPADLFSALRRSPPEFVREMRLAAAIHWYSQSQISMEKAAKIADLPLSEFLAELARRKVDVFAVDMDELKRELERA